MRLTERRARWRASAAVLLLVLRGLGGGMLVLAHAAEAPTAPNHLEAPQQSGCVVVHDELRCAVCHVVAIGVTPIAPHVVPAARTRRVPRPVEPVRIADRIARTRTTPPRAPPALPV